LPYLALSNILGEIGREAVFPGCSYENLRLTFGSFIAFFLKLWKFVDVPIGMSFPFILALF
jgi:hypothetical protein